MRTQAATTSLGCTPGARVKAGLAAEFSAQEAPGEPHIPLARGATATPAESERAWAETSPAGACGSEESAEILLKIGFTLECTMFPA